MKINDILIENKQEQLDELNLGKAASAVARGAGKVVGGVAKGAGAVAGGIAGIPAAVKKGFQAGKKTVAGDDAVSPNKASSTQPAGDSATTQGVKSGLNKALGAQAFDVDPNVPSAQQARAAKSKVPSAQAINQQGPTGTAPAKQQTGIAAQAMQKTAQATAGQTATKAGETLYAQVKSQVGQLDKKGKQRILQLLQKSLTAPASNPSAMGQMATQLAKGGTASTPNTMANTPVSKTNTAKPGNPNAGSPIKRGRAVKVSGKSAAPQVQTAGRENKGNIVAEGFTLFRKH
jgi:hypothetical protein